MIEIKKINLDDFFNAKGQDQEINDYFISLLKNIHEPMFYLKDIGVSAKVMNDWIKYALVDEVKEKGKWRRFALKEAIWIKFIEELRFFGIPLKTIKAIKANIYDFNGGLLAEAQSYFESNAHKSEVYRTINESIKSVEMASSFEKLGIRMECLSQLSTYITHTLSGGMNPVFIYSNEIEGFFNIGDTSFEGEEVQNKKEVFEKTLSTQSFVLINLKSLILKFFADEKESSDLNFYLGLMNSKEKKLIERIRSSNYSKITINLQEGKIVLTRAQKKDNDEIIRQIARLIKRGDFVDLEISARDGKLTKVNQTELLK